MSTTDNDIDTVSVTIETNSEEAIEDLEAVRDAANEAAKALKRLDAVVGGLGGALRVDDASPDSNQIAER